MSVDNNLTRNLSRMEDADLLERARAGDRAAVDELLRRYRPQVEGFLKRRTRHADEADDLANSADRIRTKPLTANRWHPKRPLIPGAIYQWQVITLDRAGHEMARVPSHADGARFKVIATDEAARLTGYRSRYGRSHLVMGTLYARQGLLDAAEGEFQALARQNTRSDIARALLRSLHALKTTT